MDSVPTLPKHLATLVARAARKELPDLSDRGFNTPEGTNFYVLAWGASYLTNKDREHAAMRLETVFALVNQDQPPPKDKPSPKVYQVPMMQEPKVCSCGREIWFVRTETGATLPITAEGLSHYLDCPDAKKHSKGKRK